jgi:hypothetical protein
MLVVVVAGPGLLEKVVNIFGETFTVKAARGSA